MKPKKIIFFRASLEYCFCAYSKKIFFLEKIACCNQKFFCQWYIWRYTEFCNETAFGAFSSSEGRILTTIGPIWTKQGWNWRKNYDEHEQIILVENIPKIRSLDFLVILFIKKQKYTPWYTYIYIYIYLYVCVCVCVYVCVCV